MDSLRNFIDTYFSWIFKIGLVIVILASLFLFTNLTTEFYDTSKFLVLFGFTALLLILTTIKYTLSNKVVLVRTPIDIPLLLLLSVALVSTVLSPSPYVSLLGNQLKVHGSLVSIIVLVLFYFAVVNNLKGVKTIRFILSLSVLAAALASLISLVAYAGVKVLPSPWNHGINFTTTGSSFSTTAILALLIPVIVNEITSSSNLVTQIISSVALTLFGITVALTGTFSTWTASVIGLVLTLFANKTISLTKLNSFKPAAIIGIVVPIAATALITILSFVPPMGNAKNPLYNQAKNFPIETQLSFIPSWKISVSAFRDTPFWGSGPSTYLFDFTNYKPIEFNSTNLWNLRFDSSFNEYLTVLATLGGVGLLALLSLTALFISSAGKVLMTNQLGENNQNIAKSLAISGLIFFVILALHTSTLVLWIMGLIIIAAFMVINSSEGSRSSASNSNMKQIISRIVGFSPTDSSIDTIRVDALPSILLTASIAIVIVASFYGAKFALADYHHRLALNAVSQNQGIAAYNELIAAEKLNPVADLYRTDLAQTNFALANAIASAKAPTDASPSGSLTDQDKQNIQVLLQQSINEGKFATTLSPRSAINWEILALLYRQISGVAQNALAFSLDSYGKAIFQDPLNPILRLNVGGTYYAIKNYDLAIRFLTDAINLKPDYANAYYNLSVAFRDKGDLNSALAAAQKVVDLVDKNSQDYKVATDYINDLKSKTEKSNQQNGLTAPTSNDKEALQQQGLPKVIDLKKPEKIATPAAIKKPASPAGGPDASPSPTANP